MLRSTCVDSIPKLLAVADIISNNQQQELLKQAVSRDIDEKSMHYCLDKLCKHTSLYLHCSVLFCDVSIVEATELITSHIQ
jgi:hypothetical protein